MIIRVFSSMRPSLKKCNRINKYIPMEYRMYQQRHRHSEGFYFIINNLNRWEL